MSESWELVIAGLIVTTLLVLGLWLNLTTDGREKR